MKYNVPVGRYNYSLGASDKTDHIVVQVVPPAAGAGKGLARLILDPQSPGSPTHQENNLSLTDVSVTITAPRCLLDTLIPKKEDVNDAGFSGGGQTASWTVGNVFKGSQRQFSVNYVLTGPSVRRFEFALAAAELPDPIRLQVDVNVPA